MLSDHLIDPGKAVIIYSGVLSKKRQYEMTSPPFEYLGTGGKEGLCVGFVFCGSRRAFFLHTFWDCL